jgi:hypothetical protein
VVGTLLGLLNHYQAVSAWSLPPGEAAQIGLTYLVPFSVATFGQVTGKRQRDRHGAQRCRCPDCPAHAPSALPNAMG